MIMKTYENESTFVNNFAKDCKESLRKGQNFEAEINGCNIVVTGMDNNNSSKVTIYTCTIDGAVFAGSITALKKRLNITYTKEYNRSVEGTKVAIKTDEELRKTAETAADRYKRALATVIDYSRRYFCAYPADMNMDSLDLMTVGNFVVPSVGESSTVDIIFRELKEERDSEVAKRESEAVRKAEEVAKKLAEEKAKIEKQLAELQAKLAKMK